MSPRVRIGYVGGLVIDAIHKRTNSIRKSRVYILCFGLMMAAIFFGLLAFSSTLHMSIAFISLGLGFTFLINPAIYSLNADLFPKNIGTAQSLSTCFFALAGIISPTITGWITQTTGSYESVIIAIAILALAASLNAFFFLHPKQDHRTVG